LNSKKIYLLALLPFAVLIVFYEIIPIIMVVVRSFMPAGSFGFTLEHFEKIFSSRFYQQSIVNSVMVSIGSSLIGLFIAFWGAKAANASKSKLRTYFLSILNMTSNFAGIPLAFAYIILLGNVGVLVMLGKNLGIGILADFRLYTAEGLMLTFVYFQVPLATMLLIPAFDALRKEWGESVSLLGGGSFHYYVKIALPVMTPSILGTLSILFANALSAYATAYALLLNNYALLPIRIAEQFSGDVMQQKEFGSALAVVMMLLMVAAILINHYFIRRQKHRI